MSKELRSIWHPWRIESARSDGRHAVSDGIFSHLCDSRSDAETILSAYRESGHKVETS